MIGTWGPFKRYTVSTMAYGFANMFAAQFPRCGNPRGNGIIVLPDSFFRVRYRFYYSIGGSRVGARGARASPLVLNQTEALRAEKAFF